MTRNQTLARTNTTRTEQGKERRRRRLQAKQQRRTKERTGS